MALNTGDIFMKYKNFNPFIAYAVDEMTTSNDWLDRFEVRTKTELRKAKNHAQARKLQKRTQGLQNA